MALPGDGKEAPREFRILRAGRNPTDKGDFLFDDEAAASVMAAFVAKGLDKIQIDYEHQSMVEPPAGGYAHKPAAGWFKPEVRAGELWATAITWTKAALAMLVPGEGAPEYRYFSPILLFDKDTRRVTGLRNMALTNDPAMDEISPLAAATALNGKELEMSCEACTAKDAKIKDMEEKCTALTAKLSAFEKDDPDKKAAMSALTGVRSQLSALTGKTTEAEAFGVVAGLKAAHEELVAFKAKVEQERSVQLTGQFTTMLDGFVKAGKMTPAGDKLANQRGYWEGKAKAEGLERAIVELTACAPLLGQVVSLTPLTQPAQGALGGQATEEMNRKMGVDGKAFAEWQAKQGRPAI